VAFISGVPSAINNSDGPAWSYRCAHLDSDFVTSKSHISQSKVRQNRVPRIFFCDAQRSSTIACALDSNLLIKISSEYRGYVFGLRSSVPVSFLGHLKCKFLFYLSLLVYFWGLASRMTRINNNTFSIPYLVMFFFLYYMFPLLPFNAFFGFLTNKLMT